MSFTGRYLISLKSAYVPVGISLFTLSGIAAIVFILLGDSPWAWAGTAVAALAIPTFFMLLYLIHIPRTGTFVYPVIGLIVAGLFLALVAALVQPSATAVFAVVLAALALLYWVGYELYYSRFGRSHSKDLQIGQPFPQVTWEDAAGNAVSSHHFRGSPTLFLFFRGNWCPFCMAQVREVAAQYQQLAKRGVQIVLVSPQSHEKMAALATRFEIPMQFLVDVNSRVARQLDIFHEGGLPLGLQIQGYDSDTVMPTVIVTDANGSIIFADLTDNYRLRPEPATFLRILDEQPQPG